VIGRQQIAALRRSEKRQLSREKLVAARLFSGIIANLREKLANGNRIFAQDVLDTNIPPLHDIVDHLGKLNRTTIDAYFLFARKSTELKTRGITDPDELNNRVEEITKIVEVIDRELTKQAHEATAPARLPFSIPTVG
jgi:hypothetical protein